MRRGAALALAVAACGLATLASASTVRAAQAIGTTAHPWTIEVFELRGDQTGGLVVQFRGLDGSQQVVTVNVTEPDSQKATLRYVPGLPATTRRCRTMYPTTIPPSVDDGLNALRCDVVHDKGFTATWLVQAFSKKVPDFGGNVDASGSDVYVSIWQNLPTLPGGRTWAHAGAGITTPDFELPPLGVQDFDGFPQLLAYPRWSKFSPGGYAGYLQGRHFPLLFGSLTMSGIGVYGPGNAYGAPTTSYGRNVYIDTFNSDYGKGWRRIMGVLTQPPNGSWCYELGPKGASGGKTGFSTANRYRLTAIGPGLYPVVRVETTNPPFDFGGPTYDPKVDKWGYGFSDGQAQALRNQMAMIGPGYATKPKGKGSTDCGATLRQLPQPF